MTQDGGLEVRKERIPPVRPCREFHLMGLMACADVTDVGPVRPRCKTGLHPVKRRFIRAVLEPEVR